MPDSRTVRSKYWRIARITTLVLAPLVLITGILVYTKLYGFKHALEELVYSQTDGKYALTIGATDVRFRSLSFTFDNVRIARSDANADEGVIAVHIPFIELQFGTFSSLFTEEFNIKRLAVDDPQIVFDAKRGKQEHVMVSQELMRLYPAIESVLNRFNIELLKVNRASIQLDQPTEPAIRINFIDLLIQHWKMRDLSAQSQLKLNIEKQDLVLGNANMKFSGIEYNFHEHHLKFSDFHISTADSLTGSDIEVSGKTLLLQDLDYQDFYENLKYSLKRAEVDKPIINAHFKWQKGRKRKDLDKDVVTRMLKYAIGECSVDSAVIRDARVNIALQRGTDTIRIVLPDVDFRMHAFSVIRDSSTFQVGEVEVNLNGSELTLSRNLSLKLDQVQFARNSDLALKNLQLYSPGAKQPIAVISTVRVQDLNLMSLLFSRRFSARSIVAEDGTLHISRPSHHNQKQLERDTTFHLAHMFIGGMTLKNLAVTYVDGLNSLTLQGLTFDANNLRYGKTQQLEYQLKHIHAAVAYLRQPSQRLSAKLNAISFNGEQLYASSANVSKDSLELKIENLRARRDKDTDDYQAWKSVEMGSLRITGNLKGKAAASNNNDAKRSTLGAVIVHALEVDITQNKNKISFSGQNISTNAFSIGQTISIPDRIHGELDNIHFHANTFSTQVKKLNINYPSSVNVTDMRTAAGMMQISVRSMQMRKLAISTNDWGLTRLSTHKIMIVRNEKEIFQSDSVIVERAHGQKSSGHHPRYEKVEIFGPLINIPLPDKSSKTTDIKGLESYLPDHLIVHPGTLHTASGKKITFGAWTGDKRAGTLACQELKTSLKKSDLVIESLVIGKNSLTIRKASLISSRHWFASNHLEDTEVDARFQNLRMEGFSINDILEKNSARNLKIEMDHVGLDLRRDKRLTDPPARNKPTTLDGMITLPENIGIKTILIRDGKIQYRQVSDKTGEEGYVMLDNLSVKAQLDSLSDLISFEAKTNLYNSGVVRVNYQTVDTSSFRLNINIKELDLTKLNQIVMPLQALRIKSGFLHEYNMNIDADNEKAVGEAMITYKGLHLEIFKHNEPERKNLGSEVLTLLADGIILKHSKENARAAVSHVRVKHKSIFHYWVTSAVHGAMGAVRKGKRR